MSKLLPRVSMSERIPDTIMTGKKERGRPVHKLQVDFVFSIDDHCYAIPNGITTDFASIPRLLWSLFLPSDPEYCAAALIHDILYAGEIFNRKYNDEIFLSALRFLGVSRWKRAAMYVAVRIGGGFTYKDHNFRRIMHIRQTVFGVRETRRPLWD